MAERLQAPAPAARCCRRLPITTPAPSNRKRFAGPIEQLPQLRPAPAASADPPPRRRLQRRSRADRPRRPVVGPVLSLRHRQLAPQTVPIPDPPAGAGPAATPAWGSPLKQGPRRPHSRGRRPGAVGVGASCCKGGQVVEPAPADAGFRNAVLELSLGAAGPGAGPAGALGFALQGPTPAPASRFQFPVKRARGKWRRIHPAPTAAGRQLLVPCGVGGLKRLLSQFQPRFARQDPGPLGLPSADPKPPFGIQSQLLALPVTVAAGWPNPAARRHQRRRQPFHFSRQRRGARCHCFCLFTRLLHPSAPPGPPMAAFSRGSRRAGAEPGASPPSLPTLAPPLHAPTCHRFRRGRADAKAPALPQPVSAASSRLAAAGACSPGLRSPASQLGQGPGCRRIGSSGEPPPNRIPSRPRAAPRLQPQATSQRLWV